MTPTLEDELRTALRAATARVAASPELAYAVRVAADRRRHRRTRRTLVLAPVALVAVVAAAVLVVPRVVGSGGQSTADQELLVRPTGGDLAGDPATESRMVAAFLRGVRPPQYASASLPTPPPGSAARDEPHVVWIGTTPSGPAAVVAQRERGPKGDLVAVGFVGPSGTGETVVAVARDAEGYDPLVGAFVGRDRRTVLVLDRGEQLTWSYSHTYVKPAGLRFTDRPVVFDDGVAVLTVPAGVAPDEVAVTRPGSIGADRLLPLGNPAETEGDGPRLEWYPRDKDPDEAVFPVEAATAWPDPGSRLDGRYGQLSDVLRTAVNAVPSDRFLYGHAGDDGWYAYGGTPDGRRLVATDMAAQGDPSRVYVVLQAPGAAATVFDGGLVRQGALLPVQVRLPDGQGWLAAAKGRTLTWTDGGRTGTARDAALLPATVARVRVDGVAVELR